LDQDVKRQRDWAFWLLGSYRLTTNLTFADLAWWGFTAQIQNLMCNHYLKNTEVLSWATRRFPDATLAPDFPEHPEHTWPKSQAPVLLQTERGREMASLRWGVRVEVKGTTKLLTKYVTNARDDKLSGFTWRFSAAERRCLIPATAYFEPDGPEGQKWVVRFTLTLQPNFFFAGLWDTDPNTTTRSFTGASSPKACVRQRRIASKARRCAGVRGGPALAGSSHAGTCRASQSARTDIGTRVEVRSGVAATGRRPRGPSLR